jgi:perosamine synthetase
VNIPLFRIFWDEDDVRYVTKTIQKGSYWAVGPMIEEFEKSIAEYIGQKYCITFNSGTSALHATLLAYGISSGDEVIVPSFTFISTANSPVFVKAKPVFADIEKETFGLDPDSVNEKITGKTKAIIPVHYGGCPCRIRELAEIAEDHDILLIEEAAEAQGARIGDKKVGTFGDAAMFSFCQNKIISTGEGGAITTDSRQLFEQLKLIRSHGREDCANYFTTADYLEYVTLGYNFRISEITAALGVSQMKKIDAIIAMRQKNARYLSEGLANVPFIRILQCPPDYSSVYQLYTVEVQGGRVQRDGLISQLAGQHIASKVYFYPVHLTKFYRDTYGYTTGMLPVTEEAADRVLTLPMYPTLKNEEMDYVIEKLARCTL